MLVIGNKIDLSSERKLKNTDLLNYVNTLQKDKNSISRNIIFLLSAKSK